MSFINYGIGLAMQGNFGTIAKCPHCPAVNIKRVNQTQVTCGKIPCRDKQNKVSQLASRQRIAARKLRALAAERAGGGQ